MSRVKRLTIGIFVEHYDPFVSGVITSVKSLKYELEKAGHTVYVICPKAKGYQDKDKFVIRTPAFSTRFLDNTTVGFSTAAITRRLMRIKFDVIHSQDVFFVSLLGLRIARRQNVPYVQTIHTLWGKFFDQFHLSPIVYLLAGPKFILTYLRMLGWRDFRRVFWRPRHYESKRRWTYPSRFIWQHSLTMANQAQVVIVPSMHQRQALLDSGVAAPVKRVTNSFAPFQPQPSILDKPKDGRLRVLCVARLSSEKRVDVLLRAIQKLKDNSVELVIVGDGPQKAELLALAHGLKVDSQVRFLGLQSNESVRQIMRESDVLALASYNFDTQPVVFDEALDAGLPIVYCDPKFIEAVGSDNALLANKDAKGFASAFRQLQDPSLRARLAKASSAKAKDFRSSHSAHQILAIYEQLTADS